MSLKHIWTIGKRELVSYFSSPVAYVFIVVFLLLLGILTFVFGGFFEYRQATLASLFRWLPWLYLVLVPAVAMGLWAEERRLGTIELLLTFPITPWEAIIGKFLAAWIFLGASLFLTAPAVFTVNYLGSPDNGVIFCGYLGAFLMMGAFLSVGCLTSSLTRDQVVSFIVSLMVCLFMVLLGFPGLTALLLNMNAPAWLIRFTEGVGIFPHFEGFQRGVISLRDIAYFLSVIVFGLFTTSVTIRSLRAGR